MATHLGRNQRPHQTGWDTARQPWAGTPAWAALPRVRALLRPAAQPPYGGPDTPRPALGRSPAPSRCPSARPAVPATTRRREGECGRLRSDPAPSAPPAALFNNGPRSGTRPVTVPRPRSFRSARGEQPGVRQPRGAKGSPGPGCAAGGSPGRYEGERAAGRQRRPRG